MSNHDVVILRELAARYLEMASAECMRARRDLWRAHNSLRRTRPPIYLRALPWEEVPETQRLDCVDPCYQGYERWFRQMLYRGAIPDDYTYEPWVTVGAVPVTLPQGLWGVEIRHTPKTDPHGSWAFDPPLKRLEDVDKLVFPRHAIDEEATARRVGKLHDAIGDILPIAVDRGPAYRMWEGDISTALAHLRGLEQVMWDMVDEPEWLHRLLAFMRDGILATHQQAEAAGDWRLCAHQNQAMCYAEELPDPSADPTPVTRQQLWIFVAAQELTLVSPAMHEAFMLRYQIPIMSAFGLSAYGCCEDLTEKIDLLRKVPNLRRIAVAPRANVARCAEQIGRDYVFSWRPNPAEMVCCGFDPEHVRRATRAALTAARDCVVDITLKDVETVQGQPERLAEWVRITREVAEEC